MSNLREVNYFSPFQITEHEGLNLVGPRGVECTVWDKRGRPKDSNRSRYERVGSKHNKSKMNRPKENGQSENELSLSRSIRPEVQIEHLRSKRCSFRNFISGNF